MTDELIDHYYSLQPTEFCDIGRIEVLQADSEGNLELTVELEIRHRIDSGRRLVLTFCGATNLRIAPPERMLLQLPLLEIYSIVDHQWQGLSYSVTDPENGTISLLCETFRSRVVDRDSVTDQTQ